MAVTGEEKRFLKSWEEQRARGKAAFVAVYSFGYTIVLFMLGVAIGLFSGLRLITYVLIIGLLISAIIGAIVVSIITWQRNQKRFSAIVRRELEQAAH